jgi:anti-sigma factor RsiW
MLKCRDISELATDYAEGALPLGRRLAVRFHLAFCRMCRAYIDQFEKTRRLLAGQALAAPPPEVENRLLSSLRPAHGD